MVGLAERRKLRAALYGVMNSFMRVFVSRKCMHEKGKKLAPSNLIHYFVELNIYAKFKYALYKKFSFYKIFRKLNVAFVLCISYLLFIYLLMNSR